MNNAYKLDNLNRRTNQDGRASAFLTWEEFETGRYKMHFQLEEYFGRKGTQSFYPYAEVTTPHLLD